jgi:HlyD family secretion protein
MKKIIKLSALGFLLFGCAAKEDQADATGSFEATETIVSAEASGKLLRFDLNKGAEAKAGQVVGYIDSMQLHLTRMQLLQSQKAVLSNKPDVKAQLEALESELENAKSDKKRVENLVKGEVASQKQLDDANTRIAVLQSRIAAQKSQLGTSTSSFNEQARTIGVQLQQVEDQIRKCKIVNPITGTVLSTYANPFEMTAVGRPLYKVSDLSTIDLRAYITEDQFAKVKLGQGVKVLVDAPGGGMKTYDGTVNWINTKAEFTPKTIQTKDERANLVYAITVHVKNDGLLKIGMYGEVKF